jgi:hypothetical protein
VAAQYTYTMSDFVEIPKSLIQVCETHPDRSFTVGRAKKGKKEGYGADTQAQMPKWNLTTHSIQPRHPLTAWMWMNDPLFRVAPDQLRQRLILDATTEWQERCSNLDFPRLLSKKKALEGLGALKPDLTQARAAMIAMERYCQESPLLWILWNDEEKKLSFLDDKIFPREGGYKQIWIMREPMWDRLWDASTWSSADLVSWIQKQEDDSFKVEWPLEPATSTVKSMAAEYTAMNFSAAGLSKDILRSKLGRAKAIRKLLA